ncbi:MAG TPA: hypothetical protein PLD20_02640 [Blastocatellia bacterium]|nr:hypothetical protein [Blastocatellia bacterium]HMV84101.1 hypothetical protein [Blastocatellia bacterium]HMZ16835.1 hypothetical protein [Blastocatellia bacterium]HNG29164.1 hypothetical protein [Blastocatellia bacterium]
MTNRRQLLKTAIVAGAGTSLLRPESLFAANTQAGETIYVNPATGRDGNAGTKAAPLKSLPEVARRVNAGTGTGACTAILAEGIYAVDETVLLSPKNRKFTKENRLTIRAEVLPDDPEWNIGCMPTLIHTMPVPPTWNGRPDPLGGAANGFLVETSHVTIQGLKITGLPIVETPKAGQKKRLYAISRFNRELEDLEVAQCLFTSDKEVATTHVGVIAMGNNVNVHHCIFRGYIKDTVVYWSPSSTGHAMSNCIFQGMYSSTVWTSGIADDFEYRNNVVDSANYVWIYQSGVSSRADAGGRAEQLGVQVRPQVTNKYKVIDSYFAHNKGLTGTGTGARIEFASIDSSFLTMTGTKVTEQPIEFEYDSTKRNYLHPVAGSAAAKIGAGLFLKPGL